MADLQDFKPPEGFDWKVWVNRWDRMQERYLARRNERFEIIVRLIQGTQQPVTRVLDLGCGTGSLMWEILKAFPQVRVYGVDFDPSILWLAKARLASFENRAQVILANMRYNDWTKIFSEPMDAVVSATALHWLNLPQIETLYRLIATLLRPGGIFLNADHVGSDSTKIQKCWENHRDKMCSEETDPQNDDWEGFWNAYSTALGLDIQKVCNLIIGGREDGLEEGLPLALHLDKLREHGFDHVDCFWRCDCDAIYGGLRIK